MKNLINTKIPMIEVDHNDAMVIKLMYEASKLANHGIKCDVAVNIKRLHEGLRSECMIDSRNAILRAMRNARQN